MRIKSYFAGTVEAAMELARRELGDEAVLLNSRPAPPEARHLGVHEVVFGVETPAPVESFRAEQPPAHPVPAQSVPAQPVPRWEQRGLALAGWEAALARIERKLDRALPAPDAGFAAAAEGGSGGPLAKYLRSVGYPESFALELSGRAAAWLRDGARGMAPLRSWPRLSPMGPPAAARFADSPGDRAAGFADRGEAARAVMAAFDDLCPVEEAPPERRVVAFVGPPGGGRTSLAAKIAARACAWEQAPTAVLTCDTVRIGAAEQLRTYAGIMGAAFEVHETPRSLARAVAEHSARRLVVIDTPGWSPAQLADPSSGAAPWMEAFASGVLGAEVHLVLPAWLGAADMAAAAERFLGFGPRFLAWTRLDEVTRPAPLVAFSAVCGLRLSWFGFGQSVPEDLEAATRERWLDLALEEEPLNGMAHGVAAGEEVHA